MFDTLRSAITPGAIRKIRLQLPEEFQPLLGMPRDWFAERFRERCQARGVVLAMERLGSELVRIDHFGTYACRNIYGRQEDRRSAHATAEAIDKAEDRELFREAMNRIGLDLNAVGNHAWSLDPPRLTALTARTNSS